MQRDATIEELVISATHELDQMDKALSLTKNFSKKFDGYMQTLSSLVTGLLDFEADTNDIYVGDLSVNIDKPVKVHNNAKSIFRKRSNTEGKDGLSDSQRVDQVFGKDKSFCDRQSIATANFQLSTTYNGFFNQETSITQKNQELAINDNMVSALQMQSSTINKIIEAGEVNSRNLRDILEKMFDKKHEAHNVEETSYKVQKLKTRITKLKLDLEAKNNENNQLKIELSVNQSLKKEVDTLYESCKRDRSSNASSQKAITSACRSCDGMRLENAMLMNQLEFTVKKVELLSTSVEHMQNDFIELYKTAQDKTTQSFYMSTQREFTCDPNESHALFNNSPYQQLMDSNYNTIINKLETIEAGICVQSNTMRREQSFGRPVEFSYASQEGIKRDTQASLPINPKLIDFRYSYMTQEEITEDVHKSEYGRNTFDGLRTGTHISMPLDNILQEYSKDDQLVFQSKRESLRKSYSAGKIEIVLPHKTKILEEKNIDESNGQCDDISSDLNEEPEYHIKKPAEMNSEGRYSIVEMMNSMQNSLDIREGIFKSNANSEKVDLLRISFANRRELGADNWAEAQSSKYTNQLNIMESINEPDEASYESGSEDLHVSNLKPVVNDFYTFSNRNSERKLKPEHE